MSTAVFTKYMVAQTVKQLLHEKEFENISVGDIATRCHISRNTFYYHFKDKYDVISWIFYSEITPIIGTEQSVDNWANSLLALCRYMQDNKDFYIKVLHIQGQNSFSECLMEFYVNLVQTLLLNSKGDQVLSPEQIRVIANRQFLCLWSDRSCFQLGKKRDECGTGTGNPYAGKAAVR